MSAPASATDFKNVMVGSLYFSAASPKRVRGRRDQCGRTEEHNTRPPLFATALEPPAHFFGRANPPHQRVEPWRACRCLSCLELVRCGVGVTTLGRHARSVALRLSADRSISLPAM